MERTDPTIQPASGDRLALQREYSMKKFLSYALATLLLVSLGGCDRDQREYERRKDLEQIPGVTAVQKDTLISGENKTYGQAKKEMKALHDQVQKDMKWDKNHGVWHNAYPISTLHDTVSVPIETIVEQPVVTNVQPTGPPIIVPQPSTLPPVHLPPASVGNKKAVIVGINKYPGAALNGCVNDATDIRDIVKMTEADANKFATSSVADTEALKAWLKYNLSFTDDQIVFLRDEDATTANITQALIWLTADTKAGDIRMFWYSGHGAEWAGSDVKNQPDGQNQVICPVDFAWDEDHMIRDVQFNKLFATMPDGVIFNWGSDSCHSGDLEKAFPRKGITNRRWPISPPAAVVTNLTIVKSRRGIPHRGIVAGELDVGFLAGCQYDEFSADTQDENGRPCGAMTHYFKQCLFANWHAPLTSLAADMTKIMDQYKYDQHPQPEGARRRMGWMQK